MDDPVINLSTNQIDVLQRQFREYKALKKRYADTPLASASDNLALAKVARSNSPLVWRESEQNGRVLGEDNPVYNPVLAEDDNGTAVGRGVEQIALFGLGEDKYRLPPASAPLPEAPKPMLTWQCVNSLLLLGPSKPVAEGAVGLAAAEVGPFLKSGSAPLVLTRPFVASLRESLLHYGLKRISCNEREGGGDSLEPVAETASASLSPGVAAAVYGPDARVWEAQRRARAAALRAYAAASKFDVSPAVSASSGGGGSDGCGGHLPVAHGHASYASDLLPFRHHQRVRKQIKRDARNWERDDRRSALEADDRRRKRTGEFHRYVMAHRDDFLRYHKSRKQEVGRLARAVRQQVESVDQKKEREERRVEERRLQALKENDMEAYAELLQDTKNGRLKFLLNETDSYINTINQMIQNQRSDAQTDEAIAAVAADNTAAAAAAVAGNSSSSGKGGPATTAAAQYYASTHVTRERVIQPAMLVGGELKEYQLQGLQWLVSLYNNNLNGILADEMGLGKTIQAIALLTYLMEFKHNNGPFLVVVPLSTLSNWVNEFNRWAPSIIKVCYKGLPDERKRIFKEEVESGVFNVLLTTYEFIMRDRSSLRKIKFQYIIVDEGHRMKNADSKFAQTLGTAYSSKFRILLTGTPLQNNLPELWALLNFLLPSIFSSSDTFDQWFNKPFAAFRTSGASAAVTAGGAAAGDDSAVDLSSEERLLIVHRLHEVLRPFMLRRIKSQVLDQLPEKVEKVLRCNLSGWQRKMYRSVTVKGLANKIGVVDENSAAVQGGLNNTIMQLRKVCNHPYLFLRNYVVDEDMIRCSGKFELLDRMLPKLKAAGHRVLMFSQMVELMNVMEAFLIYRGFKFLRLDGNTTSDEREKRMYMFNDADSPYFIFLLSTRAGGLGLNLATADTVIIFDSDWNPMMDAQAQDRAHRIGQRNEVKVFRLITTSGIEERILARANDKLNLTGLVVEAGKFGARGNAAAAHSQENKALMESLLNEYSSGGTDNVPDVEQEHTTAEPDGTDADVEAGEEELSDEHQLNELMASYPGEMEIYQRMDHERFKQREASIRDTRIHYGLSPPAQQGNRSSRSGGASKASDCSSNSVLVAAGEAAILKLQNRLMSGFEIPSWLTEDSWPPRYASLMSDMMSMAPVAKIVRPLAPPGPKKRGRRPKGEEKWRPQLQYDEPAAGSDEMYGGRGDRGSDDDDDGPGADDEDNNEDAPVLKAGKVMRARKSVVYDDGLTLKQFSRLVEKQEDLAERSAKQSRQELKAQQQVNAALRRQEANIDGTIYYDVLRVVKAIQQAVRTEDGSFLAELFWEKPNKKLLPVYYQFVSHPISLKEIISKLRKHEYQHFEAIESDWALLAANARMFNLDTSPIYHDAERLRSLFYILVAPVRAKFGLSPKPTAPPLPLAGHTIIPAHLYCESIDVSMRAVVGAAPLAEEEQVIECPQGGDVRVSYAGVSDHDDKPPHLKKIRDSSGGGDSVVMPPKTPGKRGRPAKVRVEPLLDSAAAAGGVAPESAGVLGMPRVNSTASLASSAGGTGGLKLNLGTKRPPTDALSAGTAMAGGSGPAAAPPRLVLSMGALRDATDAQARSKRKLGEF